MIPFTDTETLRCACGTTTGEVCTITHPSYQVVIRYPEYDSNYNNLAYSYSDIPGDDRNYREHSRDSIEAMRPNPAIQARQPDRICNRPIGRTRWFPGLGSFKDKSINKRKRFLQRLRKGDRAVR
jgi:hypothetical protein